MRRRQDATASEEDDGPRLNSLEEIHEADRLLRQAYEAGEMDQEEFRRRRGLVYAAVTPRELWKASGHRAGSRDRADKAELWRSLRLQLAIVVFAAVIMLFVLLGTVLNNQGGTKGTPVFPWEWGKDQAKDQPAQP
jgi:anti-sigma-K factor RskA